MLLLAGANPNTRTDVLSNASVLCLAAREGFTDMVSLLLEFNASVDLAGDNGMTPLCHAASQGHIEIIRMLITKDAKVCCL